MTPTEIVQAYQKLLIVQYRTMAKAVATIGAVCTEAVAGMIYTQVQSAYDLDTAVGAQLDVLGAYVGARRRIPGFTPRTEFMAFPNYADGPSGFQGFADYSDVADPSAFWKSYFEVEPAFVMSDGLFSQLIAYLIAVNMSNCSNESIAEIMFTFFGTYVNLTDNNNMTITYTHQLVDPSQLFAIIDFLGLLPHPAGVGVNVVEV